MPPPCPVTARYTEAHQNSTTQTSDIRDTILSAHVTSGSATERSADSIFVPSAPGSGKRLYTAVPTEYAGRNGRNGKSAAVSKFATAPPAYTNAARGYESISARHRSRSPPGRVRMPSVGAPTKSAAAAWPASCIRSVRMSADVRFSRRLPACARRYTRRQAHVYARRHRPFRQPHR